MKGLLAGLRFVPESGESSRAIDSGFETGEQTGKHAVRLRRSCLVQLAPSKT